MKERSDPRDRAAEAREPIPPADRDEDRFRTSFPAEPNAFEPARSGMREFLLDAGVDARGIHRCELAFEEICVNVIRYARGADSALPTIAVDVRTLGDEIVLTVEDDGPRFDPTAVPPYVPATTLEGASIGGRGIAMTRHATRRMSWERVGDRNRLVMTIGRD